MCTQQLFIHAEADERGLGAKTQLCYERNATSDKVEECCTCFLKSQVQHRMTDSKYSKPKYFHFLDAAGLFWSLHLYFNLCTGSQLSQCYLLLVCNLWTGSLVAYSAGHILMLGVASMRFYCSQGKARLGSSAVLNLSHHFCDSACI